MEALSQQHVVSCRSIHQRCPLLQPKFGRLHISWAGIIIKILQRTESRQYHTETDDAGTFRIPCSYMCGIPPTENNHRLITPFTYPSISSIGQNIYRHERAGLLQAVTAYITSISACLPTEPQSHPNRAPEHENSLGPGDVDCRDLQEQDGSR